MRTAIAVLICVLITGCSDQTEPTGQEVRAAMTEAFSTELFTPDTEIVPFRPAPNPERNAYFGDLHVHTAYSFDAFLLGSLATPYDAYRFARGESVEHPSGLDIKLRHPMDFYAVTDHAMFLGLAAEAGSPGTALSSTDYAAPFRDLNAKDNLTTDLIDVLVRLEVAGLFLPRTVDGVNDGLITREKIREIARTAWTDIIKAADQFNEPGRFTTFVGFEYTTSDDAMGNLHRNVIFRDSDRLPAVPFSRYHSQNPEALWDWMDTLRGLGVESLAIPHNSNASNGQMFKLEDWAGNPLDESYAEQRRRNEPLVELTQIKGTSETHPLLSTQDEWANFEIMPFRVGTTSDSAAAGSYVREALLNGLSLENKNLVNPFEFGFIGSSDTHTGASQNDESNYLSEHGVTSATPAARGTEPLLWYARRLLQARAPDLMTEDNGMSYLNINGLPRFGASGLAGVWAEENTRDAIYAGFRRKETFATSGPRVKIRFFAGYGYDDGLVDLPDAVARAYAGGVPMGGQLEAETDGVPAFFIMALADPQSAPLQRLQVIKGWIEDDGETHESVIDVACAGGTQPDTVTNRCPDNGAEVDLSDCSINRETGDVELSVLWRDPGFEPKQRAFYYARVLENPTCRWSTWDALRLNIQPRSDLPVTIQERAWSSPIHYFP